MDGEFWGILAAIGEIGAVVALLFVYKYESNQTQVIERREIYQRLEFASIDLFRFEHANEDVFRAVWVDTTVAVPDSLEYLRVKQYMCQILNLFEMSVSFLKDDIISADIFASWVIWMYELSGRPAFQHAWAQDLRANYVESLRAVLDRAVVLAEQPDGLHAFYRDVAVIVNCPLIARFGEALNPTYGKVA